MPIPSNPPFLSNVLGYAADVSVIPGATPSGSGAFSYQSAFPQITAIPLTAGGVAPMREDFNAVFKLLSQHVHFLQSGSLYPWSASLDYLVGAHVLGSDGKEYIAQKSSGPDVPSAPAVNPVGDESGTWLAATLAFGAPLATSSSPRLMQPDGITTFVNSSGVLSTALDPSWIGVPRYWRSTTLPPNHCWANGDFVEFADWPQLEQVYNAGGFAGMLMAWDADEETQAANLGQWRPDAANPTGLFTPNLGGQFFRNWAPGDGGGAGTAGGNFSQWGPPDTGVAITGITFPYVAPENGYVVFNVGRLVNDQDTEVFVNGMRVYYETSHNESSNGEQDIIPVAKGDTVTLRVAGSENPGLNDVLGMCYFLPCSFSYSSLSTPLILYLGRPA